MAPILAGTLPAGDASCFSQLQEPSRKRPIRRQSRNCWGGTERHLSACGGWTQASLLKALLGGFVALGIGSAASPAPPPNVLLILADDLNDWVGALGQRADSLTPNIDRLAAQGMVFREAYAASPKCNPSRTALLLGLGPATTGIYDNGHWWRPHLPRAIALPEAFRAAGYTVAGAGKVFHHTAGFNPPDLWDEYAPLRFDDPWDRRGSAYPNIAPAGPPPGHPLAGLVPFRHELDWGSLAIAPAEYGDARTVAWAEAFLAREHRRPFFLAAGLFRPHLPWYVPAEYFERHPADAAALPRVPPGDLEDVPAEGRRLAAAGREVFERIRASGKWREAVAAYSANIAYADALVGRLIDALDASPFVGNTIIVFASDHGFHLGEKRHWYKSTLWERSTHVPLVIRGPGIEGGGTCDRPVSLLDLYPTLLDLAGLPPRPELDGTSLGGLLRNPQSEPERHAGITYLRGNHAVRRGRWLYIRYRDGGEELYDRDADPDEVVNLADATEHRELKRSLRRLLPRRDAPAAPLKAAYRFDPDAYVWTSAQ